MGGQVNKMKSCQFTPSNKKSQPAKRGRVKGPFKVLKEWAAKWRSKPQERIEVFIEQLSEDKEQPFGQEVCTFIEDMKDSVKPPQEIMLEVRSFVTDMEDVLLENHYDELQSLGMEKCEKFGNVMESSLQEVIVQPLAKSIYLHIEEFCATNGSIFQLQKSIYENKLQTAEELGIRSTLLLPDSTVVSDIKTRFAQMMKTDCALFKLKHLLEVVRLTYNNVSDSQQQGKPSTDIGADDFLPILMWLLVQCEFTRAEIEAEYMWGLVPPRLLNGEGGYYLTTFSCAINALKEKLYMSEQTPPLIQA